MSVSLVLTDPPPACNAPRCARPDRSRYAVRRDAPQPADALECRPTAPRGGLVTLQVGTSESGANVVTVPVLLPTEYYEPFKPEASPTTAAAG
jgi:hypothetical protein